MNIRTSLLGVIVAAGLGSGAMGQCGFDVSMWQAFRAGQSTVEGQRQYSGDAFSFRRDGVSGPLLIAVHNSVDLPLSWGDVTQPFNVPQAGCVFSADPVLSQNPFRDREPQFTGIMMHPGYGTITCTAIYTAQTAVRISSFNLYSEVLGNASNGVQVTLQRVSAGGDVVPVGGTVTSQWGEDAHHMSITPIVPVQLAAGDRVVVTTSNNGDPTEDWENVELVLHVSNSAPVVLAQPRRVAACPGGSVTLSVSASGAESYQWQRGTVDLPGQDGETLTLNGLTDQDSAQYRCIVSNSCGSNTSGFGSVLVRTADIGGAGGLEPGDGQLDNNDFIVFITRFFAADARADYGAAGGLPGPDEAFDNNDFIAFINLFFNGCAG